MDMQQLSDLYEIQRLKARYFYYMDIREWDALRELFTDDMELFNETSSKPESTTPTLVGADALIAYFSSSEPTKLTIHHGHTPDIEFIDADNATGIWAMFGWSDDPGRGFAIKMYGHYHDRYVRGADGRWRIASMHLTTLRQNAVEPQPSDQGPVIDPEKMRSLAAN